MQISGVKRADDGSGDLIVRLYEACGDRTAVTVRTPHADRRRGACNLLEEPTAGIECTTASSPSPCARSSCAPCA